MDLRGSQFLTEEELLKLLQKIPEGYRNPRDQIFTEGNKYWKTYEKKGVITIEDEDEDHKTDPIVCNVLNCGQSFDSVFAYQTHYNALHRYNCSQCKKSLPSPHLLDLHLSEQHDSYFAAQAEREPMYACFLEECQHKSANQQERRDHCIRTHKFPHNFRFDRPVTLKKDGKTQDKNSEKLVCDLGGTSQANDTDKSRNFSFGATQSKIFKKNVCANFPERGRGKRLANDREMGVTALESRDMITDLMESLPT